MKCIYQLSSNTRAQFQRRSSTSENDSEMCTISLKTFKNFSYLSFANIMLIIFNVNVVPHTQMLGSLKYPTHIAEELREVTLIDAVNHNRMIWVVQDHPPVDVVRWTDKCYIGKFYKYKKMYCHRIIRIVSWPSTYELSCQMTWSVHHIGSACARLERWSDTPRYSSGYGCISHASEAESTLTS